MTIEHLTAERAREMLDYNPFTGVFRWRVKPSKNLSVDDEPGCHKDGYLVIRLDGRLYRASRLAWLITTGEWPSGQVDHRNKTRSDNRFENLRIATDSQNKANTGVRKHNKIGIKGVQRQRRKWVARITVGGQLIRLGTFLTPEDAHAAYMKAARHHFGEFARAQ